MHTLNLRFSLCTFVSGQMQSPFQLYLRLDHYLNIINILFSNTCDFNPNSPIKIFRCFKMATYREWENRSLYKVTYKGPQNYKCKNIQTKTYTRYALLKAVRWPFCFNFYVIWSPIGGFGVPPFFLVEIVVEIEINYIGHH